MSIDNQPIFGWKLFSDDINVKQTDFEIIIYSDQNHSNKVWSSGKIKSDESQNLQFSSFDLIPETRYYWTVTVWDNYNRESTSTQNAYFDTGVMGEWNDAQWIRLKENSCANSIEKLGQYLSVDFIFEKGLFSIYFGSNDSKNCFIWEFDLQGEYPILNRYDKSYSSLTNIGDSNHLRDLHIPDMLGQEQNCEIHINSKGTIETFLNGDLIDEYTYNTRRVPGQRWGFGVSQGSTIYLDNILINLEYPDNEIITIGEEDFEKGISLLFPNAKIVNLGENHKAILENLEGNASLFQLTSKNSIFYTNFDLTKPILSAKLYSSALGIYDVWINNQRIGHISEDGSIEYEELKPGWTNYLEHVNYSTHDITNLLKIGNNSIGALVAPGWARGNISKSIYATQGISYEAFIGKIKIKYIDGTEQTIVTDSNWLASAHAPLMEGEIYSGEYFDGRRLYPWANKEYQLALQTSTYKYKGVIDNFEGPYVKTLSPLEPIKIIIYQDIIPSNDFGVIDIIDEYDSNQTIVLSAKETAIYDFGQNMAALPNIKLKGKPGTRVHLRFAEILNDTGNKNRFNDGPAGSIFRSNLRSDDVNDIFYVIGEKGEGNFQSFTSFYGYRYCEVTTSDDIEITNFISKPITSAHTETGNISVDNDLVNRLYKNIKWGQRSNMISIPIDCPSRNERLGWAGDAMVFANTGMYNADVSQFLRKWLRDMRESQREDGAYSDIAPYCLKYYGNSGWADAGIVMTWNVYLMTGQKEIIIENYEAMSKYMVYLSNQKDNDIKYPGGGIAYGDWLAYEETSKRFISQAYYAYNAQLMSKMAYILSEYTNDRYFKEAEQFNQLVQNIKEEIEDIYFDNNGLKSPTQTSCVMSLHFDLCSSSQRQNVINQLETLIIKNDYRLSTGFLGTAYLNLVLSDVGLNDLAYNLLLQRKNPSWLYCVDNGATTLWEYWNSYTEDKGIFNTIINSFNHYAFGAVGEWMYSRMAGIATSEENPGFKQIIFSPYPDMRKNLPSGQDNIRHVKATYESKYGTILSEWSISNDDQLKYHIVVPPNTTGQVKIPVSSPDAIIFSAGQNIKTNPNIEYLGYENGRVCFNVGSGEYNFSESNESGIQDNIIHNINLYPNPTKDYIEINGIDNIKEVRLFNVNGNLVGCWSQGDNKLDISHLAPNLYIVKIIANDEIYVSKIIKV